MPTLELPRLRADQYAIATHPAKRKECAMGRRWGKTVLGGVLEMNVLRQHGKCAWVVPTYKNGRSLWRWVQRIAYPMTAQKLWDVSKAERTITTHLGGFFAIYSDDNIDAIRSEDFDLVINDEASRIKEESIHDAIMPTLADRDGSLIDISTPKGMNWWYTACEQAKADKIEHAYFCAPSSANPNPNIQKAARLAKDRVPDRTYRQEWLAEFIQDGQIFRFVDARATATEQQQAIPGHQYIMGVDWGKTEDYTVLTIVDMTTRELVQIDRFNTVDYVIQIGRLKALYDRFTPIVIVAEQNSIGMPIIEQLWREPYELPVQPFVTSNATKARIIEDLLLAFEQNTIGILDDPILKSELKSYAVKKTPTGLPMYGAPDGMHDDCVMSLAIAWSAAADVSYVR